MLRGTCNLQHVCGCLRRIGQRTQYEVTPPAVAAQVLLGGFGATTPNTVTQQIAAASTAGLASVPSICGGKCANLSGAWGFQIADEPGTSQFAELAPLVATAKAAGQLAFVNLLPN